MNAPNPFPASTETVRLAIAGDRDAFGQLVDAYAGMVTGVAYSILGDFARSEDAGQEAFLEAWKKRETLKDPAKFPSWVCAIARHRALDLIRKTSRSADRGEDIQVADPATVAVSAEAIASTNEEKQLVWSSLDSLPDKYREVMVLYYRGEESVAQVADSLGESESTIRQRLVRGRQMLKQEVEAIVHRTLRGTVPKAIFTAAVLGSLPGNAVAAMAGASAVGLGSSGANSSILGAGAKAAVTGVMGGAALGTLGGLLGGGLGTYFGHRNAPFMSQKRLIKRYAFIMLVWMLALLVAVGWLVSRQTSDAPLSGKTYGVSLLSVIIGFQFTAMILAIWMARRYRRLGSSARRSGEPLHPDVAVRVAKQPKATASCYTSSTKLLNLPIMDVQFNAAMVDGAVETPLTARGWIALGDRAHGILLGGGTRARGLVAVGSFAFGGITIGGFGCGLINLCGVSLGAISLGGLAIGWLAFGGLSIGVNAFGGLAAGINAVGGAAFGWNMADGGMAWSHELAQGGLVLGGQAGEAASAEIATNWFMSAGKNLALNLGTDASPGPWWQVAIVVGVIFVCCLGLSAVYLTRILLPSTKQPTPGSGSVVDRTRILNNDNGAFYGSFLGCTAWMVGLDRNAIDSWTTLAPIVIYLIGASFCVFVFFRFRDNDGLAKHLTTCLIMSVALTLVMGWHVLVARRDDLHGLWMPTVVVLATLVLVVHAVLAIIMSQSRQMMTSQSERDAV